MEHEEAIHEAASHAAATPFWGDAATWAGVGLLIFIALLVWKKIPGALTKSLDDRADKIRTELERAETLRKEAEAKLEEAKKRAAEAEAEAAAIVEFAKKEAAVLSENAAEALKESIARRQKMAEERIARAEAEAIRDVRAKAVETASAAARKVLEESMSGKAGDDHFAASLEAVRKALQ